MPETQPQSNPSAPVPPTNGATAAPRAKMVMFGVEVDAPEGYVSAVSQPLPKARGAFMPIVIGLTFFALVGVTVYFWDAATTAEKTLAHQTTELETATAKVTDLTAKVNAANEKVRALETEKTALTTDVTAKNAALTEADELLAKRGLKRKLTAETQVPPPAPAPEATQAAAAQP